MEDETQIHTKEELTPKSPSSSTETETKTLKTVIETGKPKSDESMIMGASGRFWITFVLAIGLLMMPVTFIFSNIEAQLFLGIYTSYIGVAGMAIGTYLGQNKPKPN